MTEANQNLERHKALLGGIVAIIRTQNDNAANSNLLNTIRSGVDLSQLAAHVRNARRSNPSIEAAFSDIEFVIDGSADLPSPTELLASSSIGSIEGLGGSESEEKLTRQMKEHSFAQTPGWMME